MPDTLQASNHDIDRLMGNLDIPPCPAIVADFMAESRRDEPDLRRVAHLIGRDAALSAAVLKTVNSPFYGLRHKARSVHDALALLGLRCSAQLISGLLLRRVFGEAAGPVMERFWDVSGKLALVSAYLARELSVASMEEAHSYGLFRDCGTAVLAARHADYTALYLASQARPDPALEAAERARYGLDHAHVGAALSRLWHLRPATCEAILLHHDCESACAAGEDLATALDLIALGALAESLLGGDQVADDGRQRQRDFALATLQLAPADIEPLAADIGRILAG